MHIQTKMNRPKGLVTPVIRKLVDGEMKEVRSYDRFENVITNNAILDRLITQGTNTIFNNNVQPFRYLRVGTGTAEYTADTEQMGSPDNARYATIETNLGFFLGEIEDGGEYFISCQVAYAFGLGELNGTFTEVATFNSTTTNTTNKVHSGTLFKDTEGDPVSITVASDEQLIIYYEFRLKISQEIYNSIQGNSGYFTGELTDVFPSPINVNGTDHSVTSTLDLFRYYRIGGDSGTDNTGRNVALYGITANGNGYSGYGGVRDLDMASSGNTWVGLQPGSSSGEVDITYTVAANKQSVTFDVTVTITPGAGLTDIRSVRCMSHTTNNGLLVMDFDPTIPLDPTEKMTITFTYTIDWSGA